MSNAESWIRLAEALGARARALRPLLETFGTPDAIFAAPDDALRSIAGLTEVQRRALRAEAGIRRAADIARECRVGGYGVLTMEDAAYPACLRGIAEPPAVLYTHGKLPDFSIGNTVGVVGTRHPHSYGEEITYRLCFALAGAGLVTVSGMAQGVDGVAAAATLAAGGRTVAVLGCGIDRVYPRHHGKLRDAIAAHGAVLSEFAPGTDPSGWNFPIRNRLISALSAALLVTEAPRGSGALITARYAALQGKLLFATPGEILAPAFEGSNELLREGALPVLEAGDILRHFRFVPGVSGTVREAPFDESALVRFGVRRERPAPTPAPAAQKPKSAAGAPAPAADLGMLDPRQREIFALLPGEAFSPDYFEGKGIATAEAVAALTVFEIYGLVKPLPGGLFLKLISD